MVIVAVVALLWSTVTQTDRSTRELSSYAELEKKIEAGEIYGVAMYDSQSGTNVILAVTKAHEQNFKNIESRYDYLVRFNGTETSYDDFYAKFKNNKYVAAAFTGLRPMTVGLIGAAALLLMNKENFIDYKSILIFAGAFLLTWKYKIHPILMICLAGVAGLVIYW